MAKKVDSYHIILLAGEPELVQPVFNVLIKAKNTNLAVFERTLSQIDFKLLLEGFIDSAIKENSVKDIHFYGCVTEASLSKLVKLNVKEKKEVDW
jgi:hypothetical protein